MQLAEQLVAGRISLQEATEQELLEAKAKLKDDPKYQAAVKKVKDIRNELIDTIDELNNLKDTAKEDRDEAYKERKGLEAKLKSARAEKKKIKRKDDPKYQAAVKRISDIEKEMIDFAEDFAEFQDQTKAEMAPIRNDIKRLQAKLKSARADKKKIQLKHASLNSKQYPTNFSVPDKPKAGKMYKLGLD